MVGIQDFDKLRVAYLFQSMETNFSESNAPQLHILYTLRGLQERGHHASLMALQPQRHVLFTDDIKSITSDQLAERYYANTGLSDGRGFKYIESGVRKLQSALNLPYLALFDDMRMYEAARNNLRNYHLIHERYSGIGIGGALASKKLGIPFILEVNGDMFEQSAGQGTPIKGLLRLMALKKTRYCFDRADKIICVSWQLRDYLIEKWNLPPEKTTALACAADVDAFSKQYDTEIIREKLHLDHEPVILFIGRFFAWHNLDLLIESFCKVLQKVPTARLVLVGDGKTKESIEHKIIERDIEYAVRMVGRVDHEKIPELLSIADVAVSPLTDSVPGVGGTPVKLFEYMAASKAIVVTKINTTIPVIEDGNNGILVEPGDVDGFTEAITKILIDKEERDRLGRNARQRAVAEHSWKHYSELLENIYLEVIRDQV